MNSFLRLSSICLSLLFATANLSAQTTDQGGEAGGDGNSLFRPGEVDSSAFDQIERGESIGSTSTQGFGVTAESGGNTGGGGGGGNSFFGGGGFGGLGALFGNAFGGQATTQKPTLRVRLKSAVNVMLPTPVQRQQSARRVFSQLPPTVQMQNVNISMNGRTAVLTGSVGTDRERRMAELLMKLEPGVRSVENRISTAP